MSPEEIEVLQTKCQVKIEAAETLHRLMEKLKSDPKFLNPETMESLEQLVRAGKQKLGIQVDDGLGKEEDLIGKPELVVHSAEDPDLKPEEESYCVVPLFSNDGFLW
jgi:hypothetical protein